MSNNSPELPSLLSEQRLVLPWLVVERDRSKLSGDLSPFSLLVSSPDGALLEFDLPENVSKHLGDVLADQNLWKTFFTSLLDSFRVPQVVP